MRHRASVFLLLACLTGSLVLIHAYRNGQRCASIVGPDNASVLGLNNPDGQCTAVLTHPLWAQVMGLISIGCLAASGWLFNRGSHERRQELRILRDAGIDVDEASLPLEP